MILAAAALLSHMDDDEARAAGRAIREASLEAVSAGVRTADLGGHASTTEFTDEVIGRILNRVSRPSGARPDVKS
jgi:isocitrate dehydrogenase (NAD+)